MRNSLIFTLAALALAASNFAHAGDGTTPLPSQYRVNVPDEEQYPDDQQQEEPQQQYAPPVQQAPTVVINNYYNQTSAQFEAPGYGLDQGFDASFCQISYTQGPAGIIGTIYAGDPDIGWQQLWQDYVGPNFINLRVVSNALQLANGGDLENGYCQNFGGIVDVSDYQEFGNGYLPHPYGYRGNRRFGFGIGYGGGYVSPRFIPGRNGFDAGLQYRQGTNARDIIQQRGFVRGGYGRGGLSAPVGGQYGGRFAEPQGGRVDFRQQQQQQQEMQRQQQQGQNRGPVVGGGFRGGPVAVPGGGGFRGPVGASPMAGGFRGGPAGGGPMMGRQPQQGGQFFRR